MYIVWKRRPLQGPQCNLCGASTSDSRASLIPLLVASRRVGGKPRQTHVPRLSSIRNCCLSKEKARQEWFRHVEERLAALHPAGLLTRHEVDAIRTELK